MTSEQIQTYGFPILLVGFFAWRFWNSKKMKATVAQEMTSGAVIVDVRSPGEFSAAHNPKSINIPLGSLTARIKELDKSKKIILCCASGGRSQAAIQTLKENGFSNVINAGPWTNTLS